MLIETHRADIATFSVTIQALHVNSKQMTLAVFRQLPVDNWQPGDEPWGIVKYDIKDQGDEWVVFSRENQLFRRTLIRSQANAFSSDLYYAERNLLLARTYKDSSKEQAAYDATKRDYDLSALENKAAIERDTAIERARPQLFIAV